MPSSTFLSVRSMSPARATRATCTPAVGSVAACALPFAAGQRVAHHTARLCSIPADAPQPRRELRGALRRPASRTRQCARHRWQDSAPSSALRSRDDGHGPPAHLAISLALPCPGVGFAASNRDKSGLVCKHIRARQSRSTNTSRPQAPAEHGAGVRVGGGLRRHGLSGALDRIETSTTAGGGRRLRPRSLRSRGLAMADGSSKPAIFFGSLASV